MQFLPQLARKLHAHALRGNGPALVRCVCVCACVCVCVANA